MLESATKIIHGAHSFGFLPISPKNGTMNIITKTATVTHWYGSMRRRRNQCVSSGRLPYQMMMYWAKVR